LELRWGPRPPHVASPPRRRDHGRPHARASCRHSLCPRFRRPRTHNPHRSLRCLSCPHPTPRSSALHQGNPLSAPDTSGRPLASVRTGPRDRAQACAGLRRCPAVRPSGDPQRAGALEFPAVRSASGYRTYGSRSSKRRTSSASCSPSAAQIWCSSTRSRRRSPDSFFEPKDCGSASRKEGRVRDGTRRCECHRRRWEE
jgi:hypothetical protein